MRALLPVALACASCFPLCAQQSPTFQRFGIEQGLTVTTAFSIVQDDDGFLWISTIDGLVRFDGYQFTTYKNNFNDSLSLSDNTLSTIYKDKKGSFWVGTYNEGVNCFDPRTGRSKRYDAKASNPNHLSNGRVWAVCEDGHGSIWVGTDHGLNLLDPATGKVTRFMHDEKDPYSISSDRILCLNHEGNETWIGTDNGLNRVSSEENGQVRFERFYHDEKDSASLAGNIILSLSSANNTVLAGTTEGLSYGTAPLLHGKGPSYYFESIRFTAREQHSAPPGNITYSYLNSYGENSVRSIWKRSNEEWWLATDKGLKILHLEKGKRLRDAAFSSYRTDPANNRSLSADLCLCLSPDRSGNLWIGTMVGGINKVDLKPKKFQLIQTGFGNPYNLSADNIRAVYVDHEGTLWVGTLGGGLNRMDAATGKFERVRQLKKSATQFDPENVWCICEDRSNIMWIGTSKGLFSYDPASGKFTAYTHDPGNPSSLSNNIVRSILQSADGQLWVGTEGGLNRWKGGQEFWNYLHDAADPGSLSNNTVWTVKEWKGEIWVGTDDGLDKVGSETANEKQSRISFTRYNTSENKHSLSNRSVRSVFCDRSGNIWAGTNNGLNRYRPETNDFIRYSEADGMANSFIYAVLDDKDGNLWISTNFGISKFNVKEKKFRNYDKLDGLQNNEFNTGAWLLGNDGKIYFGGPDGLNYFYPEQVKDNPNIPPVVITSIKLFGSEMKCNTEPWEVRDITLRYDENVLAFEFAGLDLTQPEKNQYAYQLIGFDKTMITSGNRRFVSYTNLDPGEYTFKVTGSNNDGVWNNEGCTIHITIVPPFWKTWWFYAIAAGMVVMGAYSAIRIRFRRLKRIQDMLSLQVELKTKELREEKDTVESQKKLIEKKNQNITSSIRYAQRIQESIFPVKEKLNDLVPEAFIFFKPKDIVSGDFYWFNRQKDVILVAAVDCTGHGVPGAFMSLIGNNLLNNIVVNQQVTDPKRVLELLHEGVVQALKKNEVESETVDGMDITLCAMDVKDGILNFASTGRPLFLVRGRELKKFKVGSHPVGFVTKKEQGFGMGSIKLELGDTFYIFTDGYCDQFGGPKDNKFMECNFEELLLSVQERDMQEQCRILEATIEDWKGETPQLDDMLVIGIRF
jgi:ligand-binding sensor domain-containing protein/serine phosphatase RsbU (regulator of sigma subunit)